MSWQILQSGRMSPQAIMAKDEALLNQILDIAQPILHLYEWEGNCLTYGYFIHPFDYLDEQALQAYQIQIARRPTGGGIIFHLTDFAFSVLIPSTNRFFSFNTLENYAFINHKVVEAIYRLSNASCRPELLRAESLNLDTDCCSFCMAKPTQYDLIVNGKKIGGAAQRRTKNGFLHQGSLSLAFPPLALLKSVMKQGTKVLESMQQHTYTLLGEQWAPHHLTSLRDEIRQHLIDSFTTQQL